MGCCENKDFPQSCEGEINRIKNSIKDCNPRGLSFHLLCYQKLAKTKINIDGFVFKYQDIGDLNLLGYALLYGSIEVFKFIHINLKASIEAMERLLNKLNTTSLSIICENNYTELFQYLAPLYFELPQIKNFCEESFKKCEEEPGDVPEILYTPVQLACYYGNIAVISCILEFTSDKDAHPLLDIHAINKKSGENCALIACRSGNYNMIKFLHINCNAEFFICNKNQENALQVLLASAQTQKFNEVFQCLVYLHEKIGLDILNNYKETIRLINQEKLLFYFLLKLEDLGIIVSEEELEHLKQEGMSNRSDSINSLIFRRLQPEKVNKYDYSITTSQSSYIGAIPNVWY